MGGLLGRRFGVREWGKGSPSPPPPSPSPPSPRGGERGRVPGASGRHLTFPDGAIRGRGVVREQEASSVPAVAAPAPRGDGALVFRGHGGLVDGWAVLMGERSCCWVPVGAGICVPGSDRDTKEGVSVETQGRARPTGTGCGWTRVQEDDSRAGCQEMTGGAQLGAGC